MMHSKKATNKNCIKLARRSFKKVYVKVVKKSIESSVYGNCAEGSNENTGLRAIVLEIP